MNRFANITGRASGFADGVGETVKALVPNAERLIQTGMKLGVLKNGARVARVAVRRYPIVTAATIVGGGLLWYAARRRARRAEDGNDAAGEQSQGRSGRGGRRTLEGSAQRVDARSGSGDGEGSTRKRGGGGSAAARKRSGSTRSARSTH